MSRTDRQKRRTDRQTYTQTYTAYKGLQVTPFNLTVIVGNDNDILL